MDQELLSRLNVVVWEADPDTFEFRFVSPQLADWLGQPPTAVTHWFDAIYGPDKAWVVDLCRQKLAHQTNFHLQYRLQTAVSERMWVQDRISVVHENGRAVALYGIRLPQGYHNQKNQDKLRQDYAWQGNDYTIALQQFSHLTPATPDFQAIAQQGLQELKRIVNFDTAVIYLTPHFAEEFFFASAGYEDEAYAKTAFLNLMEGNWLLQQMAQIRAPVNIPDVRQLDSWVWLPDASHIRSCLGIPLLGQRGDQEQQMIGGILLDSSQTAFFEDADLNLVIVLARYLALALENARLYPLESRRRQMAEILNQIASNLTSTLNLDEVLVRTVEAVGNILPDIQSCTVSILEQEGTYLRMRQSWIRDESYEPVVERDGAYVADTYASRITLEKRDPFVMEDIDDYSLFKAHVDVARENKLSALLYLPLMVYQEPIGLLHIHVWDQPRKFTAEEISLCQSVANYAAVALENARLFTAERHQLHLSQMLQRVGALLTTGLTLEQVYEQLFDLLAEVVAYDSVSIQLIDKKEGRLKLVAGRGFADWDMMRRFVSGLTEHSLLKIEHPPHWSVIPDTWASPKWIKEEPADYIRSWIGAALMVKGEIIGILNVDSRTCQSYDEEMGKMVAAFANQAAAAIENASLYEETRQRARELSILHQVAQDTAVTLDVDELLHQTTAMITSLLYPDVFSFVMVDEASGQLRPHASSHGIPAHFFQTNIPYEDSVVGRVVRTGLPYLVEDVITEPNYFEGVTQTRSEVAVPLMVNGRVIAAINVESPVPDAFTDSDVRFLVTLASQVATAIERVQLYRTLRDQANSLARQVDSRTAELQAEKERTLAILENAGEGIVFTDPNTTILYANSALEQQSGYRRNELLGQPLATLIQNKKAGNDKRELEEAIAARRRWSGEMRICRRDGQPYDLSLTITPIQRSDEQFVGFVGILWDITRLKELDRLKTKFVSNVSHELRTPLTNIKTYLTLLERGPTEKRDRYLQVLNHETDRLARLIEDLLNLSRLETEPLPLEVQPVNLARLLQEFYELFLPKAEDKGLQLHLLSLLDLPPVLMEEHHLAQLVSNLLANALAYCQPHDEILLEAGRDMLHGKTAVWFQVVDTGPGIEAADIPRLFDRFYRGRRVQELNIPGTGLGLAICQEIVNRYGGRLDLTTEAGIGSKFTVYLPAVVNGDQ
jgi:PAS domain S-box-containing protein